MKRIPENQGREVRRRSVPPRIVLDLERAAGGAQRYCDCGECKYCIDWGRRL